MIEDADATAAELIARAAVDRCRARDARRNGEVFDDTTDYRDDVLRDRCNCGGNRSDDPTNPDWHTPECAGLAAIGY
ncbi:hypothetical protein ACFWIB_15325 [Streptomyces sp. NPDC127051]|uniref:hypothetical protein n=1 Tax=Streptomyces sp. NPDC127051 TaxID=3347119 RepID=UPI00366350AD